MTNSNVRGSAANRRARRVWLMESYASDVAGCVRCYRCGDLLSIDELTVDRIKPQALGGTYRRNNIRPSCSPCATITGNELKARLRGVRLSPHTPGRCVRCGCTDDDCAQCIERQGFPCAWVDHRTRDLCTACVDADCAVGATA